MTAITIDPMSRARVVRAQRVCLARRVREGRVSLNQALEDPSAQTMLVFDLLLMLPNRHARGRRSVRLKADKRVTILATSLFAHIQRGPLVRVKDLTQRECDILVYAYNSYLTGSDQ